ncbi:hypothetical protein Y017_04875 [Alcanivorax sp. 97CO-5]|nr:hypothetical protein [Alcanivorax sp. 97CO-6]EUC68426.1 hypothetical protein Y017_04875 [Alcanivorax sp. 97CO-5]PKG00775.1 hypothetical protein Y019_12700 [Alcanivorax sp. 97CO-6]
MFKSIAFILMLAAQLLLGGCSTTYHENLVSDLQKQGDNPYIVEPELKDLEQKIRAIVMAERSLAEPYRLTFDPRNEAIISYFQDQFSKQEMMKTINLVRAGYEAVVAARYPNVGLEAGCALVDSGAFVISSKVAADQFEWSFIHGDCVDGLAHGVGKAMDEKHNAVFVGKFNQGVMVEGVFNLLQEDGREVIQVGQVPGTMESARLLVTEIRKTGFQWIRYGDFNDSGGIDGFAVSIWAFTNTMVVKSIGGVENSFLSGFAAKQELKPWKNGKIWNVWIGHFMDGNLNGPGAWSNGMAHLSVGYWKDGSRHGKTYGEYAMSDDNNESYAGIYVNGERDGAFRVQRRALIGSRKGEFIEIYANGELIDDGIAKKPNHGDTLGKFVALAGGAAVIGSSGITDSAKVDIGTAFATDILAGGNGQNINAMRQSMAGGAGAGSNASTDSDKGVFSFSCYDPGNFICVDYTLYSRTKSEQFKAQCSQGNNKLVASCDSSTRQAICSHQSPVGKTDTHDYLYGSEPEQVKQACVSTGGQFKMVE